jgi:hypothetical protein
MSFLVRVALAIVVLLRLSYGRQRRIKAITEEKRSQYLQMLIRFSEKWSRAQEF